MTDQKLKVPGHLSPEMKRLWRFAIENYTFDELSAPLLNNYLTSIDLAEMARKEIMAAGINSKARDALKAFRENSTGMARAFRHLGLDLAQKP
jgi:hypothetical protein